MDQLPCMLSGQLILKPGTPGDYRLLHRFHYLPKFPRTYAVVRGVWYREATTERLIAVGVLSYPYPCCRMRERYFGMVGRTYGEKLRFANANLRTISRVVVHPQFRSLGLASTLVRALCLNCPTPYVEASARMGAFHPMFERAGMKRIEPVDPSSPAYFVIARRELDENAVGYPSVNSRFSIGCS